MNILSVDGRDECLVQLPGNLMGNTVPDMLNVLDALGLFDRIPEILRHVFQETTPLDHVVRRNS
jgi:hypothetical protein